MKDSRGILFDFNGTMYLDSDKQEKAWIDFLVSRIGRRLTEDEILNWIHGRVNQDILRHFIHPALTAADISQLSDEKEAIYRELCLTDPEGMHFTQGLERVLDTLKEMNIPMTIATASPKVNVDFFIEVFHLERWFETDLILYNDGTFPGKPAPDIYLKAAAKIGKPAGECIVIEDAVSGIRAAHRAGVGRIIGIPAREHTGLFREMPEVWKIIENFEEFDYHWLPL